jgi:hypothetical protein
MCDRQMRLSDRPGSWTASNSTERVGLKTRRPAKFDSTRPPRGRATPLSRR